jgi:hypothetical protein
MYDFIINVPINGPSIPTSVPVMGGLPINSPLVGSFLGVLFAFSINYIYKFIQDLRSRNHYRKNIKLEIELCIERLKRTGDLLPTDRWSSAINSGALKLFDVDETDQLSKLYEGIQNYNYEAKRTRDVGEDRRRDPENFNLQIRHILASWRLGGFRNWLQNLLEEYINTSKIDADEAGTYWK